MCGIIGFTGKRDVKEILLHALETLEYRGYDSAGIAVKQQKSGKTEIFKCAGRVRELRELCDRSEISSEC